jgi:hypothetical protein
VVKSITRLRVALSPACSRKFAGSGQVVGCLIPINTSALIISDYRVCTVYVQMESSEVRSEVLMTGSSLIEVY